MQFKFHWAAIALLSVFIQGCPSSGVSTTPLGGVAAVGAPLAGATVILVDAAGTTKNVTADAEGAYTFDDVGAMTAPFLLKASGVVGGEEQTIYSALDEKPTPGETAVLNATPMTNAVVAQLSDGDPAKLFAAPTTMGTFIKPADMGAAKQKIIAVLEEQMKAQDLTVASFDPFKTPFKADSKGIDKLFDLVKIRPSAKGEMVLTDKSTGVAQTIRKADNLSDVQANKKMEAPDPELKKLDFSKVKKLIDDMNSAIQNKTSVDAYFHPNFKMDGKLKTKFLEDFSDSKGPAKLSGFVFGSCKIEPQKTICEGNVAFVDKGGAIVQGSMPVIFSNDVWQWYGNQRDFEFYFGQHLMIDNTFNSITKKFADPEVRIGFVLDAMQSNTDYNQIELFSGVVNSNKTIDWEQTALATWAANLQGCPSLVNQYSTASKATCSSFVEFSQLGIDPSSTSNAKMKDYNEGKLRFQLKFTKKNNSVSNVEFRPSIENIPKSDAGAYKTIITNAFVPSVTQGFGTSKDFVMPKDIKVENLTVYLFSAASNTLTAPNLVIDSMGIGFTKFGESISIAELCAVHKEVAQNSTCSATDIITAIYWTFKTPLSVDTKVTYGLKFASP